MSRRAWLPAYLGLVAIWGCSFLFNELALRSFSAIAVAFGRISLGALTLVVVLLVLRQPVRLKRSELVDLVIVAAILTAVPFALIAFAQTRVTSILAGLLNATTPLWVAIFVALLIPLERATRQQGVGLLLGFAGIGVLLGVWNVEELDLVGVLAMLGATACYGFGTAWMRWRLADSSLSGASLSAVQLLIATALLLPVLPLGGAPGEIRPESVVALLGLGVLGAGLAYVLFWRVVRTAGPTIAATVTYLIPLVSTTLGIVVLGEELTWNQPVGGAIALVGVALAQGLIGRRRAAHDETSSGAERERAPLPPAR
jgi:drug/metabolite transporter (DMT)-like permease